MKKYSIPPALLLGEWKFAVWFLEKPQHARSSLSLLARVYYAIDIAETRYSSAIATICPENSKTLPVDVYISPLLRIIPSR